MKLVLPAGCHVNPNVSLNTFHIRKVTLLLEAVYGLCMTTKNNGGGFLVVVYDKAKLSAELFCYQKLVLMVV